MKTEAMELYLHIPFCVKKCDYCDFLSFEAEEWQKKKYIEQLICEIFQASTHKLPVSTVFIGGGTPSCLPPDNILSVMEALRDSFHIGEEAEITIESNPGTLTLEKLNAYRDAGINRLSMGLQSADHTELSLLGRIHTVEQFYENFRLARKAGFGNINVDLMSALPGQTAVSWRNTLKQVLMLQPEHISAYSLMIEEGTPFYEKYAEDAKRRETGKICLLLPSEEEERQMYYDTAEILGKSGYRRYEISNYARKGFECRHNCGYWKRTSYLGLGLGAASLMGHERFSNTSNMQQYLKGDFAKVNREILSQEEEMEEFMFLGLRLAEGIGKNIFEETFQKTYDSVYGDITRKLIEEGALKEEENRIKLTGQGIDISNYVLAQFLL